jgi:hypothetical protein
MASAIHIEFQDLVSATDTAQTVVSAIVPDATAAVGVVGMMLTNFLASGIVCGLFNEEFVDKMMTAIRESVDDSVKSINLGLAEEAAKQTIQ